MSLISTLQHLQSSTVDPERGHIYPGPCSIGGRREEEGSQSEACRAVGVTFIPLVVESLGGRSKDGEYTIRGVGHLQGQVHSPPVPAAGHLPLEGQRHSLDPPTP